MTLIYDRRSLNAASFEQLFPKHEQAERQKLQLAAAHSWFSFSEPESQIFPLRSIALKLFRFDSKWILMFVSAEDANRQLFAKIMNIHTRRNCFFYWCEAQGLSTPCFVDLKMIWPSIPKSFKLEFLFCVCQSVVISLVMNWESRIEQHLFRKHTATLIIQLRPDTFGWWHQFYNNQWIWNETGCIPSANPKL